LRAQQKLGNANNTSTTSILNKDGELQCLYYVEKKRHWVAKWQDHQYYDRFQFIRSQTKSFASKTYGSKEAAKVQAVILLENKWRINEEYRQSKQVELQQKVEDMLAAGELSCIATKRFRSAA
jgi:hypothetical protein